MSEPYMAMDDLFDWDAWMNFEETGPDWASPNLSLSMDSTPNSTPFALDVNVAYPQPVESQHGTAEPDINLTQSLSVNTVEHGAHHVEAPMPLADDPNDFTLTKRIVYVRTTCASCGGPLDRSEQDLLDIEDPSIRCIQHEGVDHPPLACDHQGCGLRFKDLKALKQHSWFKRHKSFHCVISTCREPLSGDQWSSLKHFREHHPDIKVRCAKCSEQFDTHEQLNWHCQINQHAGYVCKYPLCGSEALRLADLHRHQLTHKTNIPRHPCPHCREYRGKNGFKRKDHLTQHIRNYHRINVEQRRFRCTVKDNSHIDAEDCPTLEAFTEHALTAHQSLPFPCKEKNCDRVGMNGFANDQLLKVHVKENHLPEYQCSFPGCDRVGMKGWRRARDMVKHMDKKHGQAGIGETGL